jgi:hypothetical protein
MDRDFPLSEPVLYNPPVNISEDQYISNTHSAEDQNSKFGGSSGKERVRSCTNPVNSDLYWSSHVGHTDIDGHACSTYGYQPFVQHFSVPSCASGNSGLSASGYSLPSNADSLLGASSAYHSPDSVQRCAFGVDALHNSLLSSQAENLPVSIKNCQFSLGDQQVHSAINSSSVSSFPSGTMSQRSQISYSDAARLGMNSSEGGCQRDHKLSPVSLTASSKRH